MPNTLRKNLRCQNCDYPLEPDFDYCPRCSQHNSDKLTSFGTLTVEVISDFFSYDSRFVKTIYPFLFRPGFLTVEFVAGRRVRYMHPLRLYLFISLLYFSVVSLVTVNRIGEASAILPEAASGSITQADSVKAEVRRRLQEKLSEAEFQKVDSALTMGGGGGNPGIMDLEIDLDKGSNNENEFSKYIRLIRTKGLTERQVLDSLQWEPHRRNLFKVRQGIRLANLDKREFMDFFMGKISLMMFIMLPFVTLFLKLLYIRRKRYYMEHLTFMLHIHAFMFLVLAVAMLLAHYQNLPSMTFYGVLLILLYMVLAFRKVYKQGWIKTLFKMFILFTGYIFSFTFFLLLTLVVSALLI
jgi:hypothetical protein